MPKNKIIKPKEPKILATVTLNNTEYNSLVELFPDFNVILNNGIFIKNLDSVQNVTIQKSSISNTLNEISILFNDEIFIQTSDISDLLIKVSVIGQQISISAN